MNKSLMIPGTANNGNKGNVSSNKGENSKFLQ